MRTYIIEEHRKSALPIAVTFDAQTPKHQKLHRHDGYEIMFIQSGYGWCAINDLHLPLLPGDLFFMGEHDEHEFFINEQGSYYNIMFKSELVFESDQNELRALPFFHGFGTPDFVFPGKCVFPLQICERLSLLLAQMLREADEGGFGLILLLRARLYDLLVQIGKYSTIFHARTDNASTSKAGKIINYVLTHYSEKISLEKLALKTNYSPEYLGKFFRRHTGINFTDYLAYVRIEKARTLLENPALSQSEIAFQTGFFDSAHFTRTFQRITGMLPRDFRKLLRPARKA